MLKNVFEKLKKDLSGELLLPESNNYEISRKLFNGMIDKKPAAIVKCRTLEDVLLSVKFAEDYHLPISVKSGGHNVAGNALCENGLVVDFGLMRAIDINPKKRTVKLQSGVTWGELDKECSKHELATTGGIISSTGVAGLTLGGGIGWLLGKYGLSCDNLMQAQVVLASGEVITANDEQNSDLMWGLRGAGSNFGIVTEFTMQLHSVKKIVAGSVYYPFDQAYQVLSFYRDFAASAPDELTLSLIISTSSSGEKQIQIDLAYLGDEKFSNKVLEPLFKTKSITKNTISVVDYVDWQTCFDDTNRFGRRSYWKPLFVELFNENFINTLITAYQHVPSPFTMITFDHLHGAASRVPIDATAFCNRDKMHLLLINTNWERIEEDEINISWARNLFDAVSDYSSQKAYVNYLGQESEQRVAISYGEETYGRLAQLKRKFDPENFFSSNQNINPNFKVPS